MPESNLNPDELPPPSAELVLIRVFVSAYLATCHLKPNRRARAFLRAATNMLATEQSAAMVLPIRPASQHASAAQARRQAVAIFRQYMPVFSVAGLEEDGE